MWSGTGLGPPTYRPFEFPYDDYRGAGMGEFASLGGAATATTGWPSAGPPPASQAGQVAVSSAGPDERVNEDSVGTFVFLLMPVCVWLIVGILL